MQGSGFNPIGCLIIFIPLLLIISLATGSPDVTVSATVINQPNQAAAMEFGYANLVEGDEIEITITEDKRSSLMNGYREVLCVEEEGVALALAPTSKQSDCGLPIHATLVSQP